MKKILLNIAFLTFFSSNVFAALAVTNSDADITESSTSLGVFVAKKIDIARGIFDFEGKRDGVYIAPQAFYNAFVSGELKSQYGIGLDFGYNVSKFDIFLGIGQLTLDFDTELNGETTSYTKGDLYYGIGVAYSLYKDLTLKLDAKFTDIDFTNGANANIGVKSNTVNLAIGFNF